MNIGFLYGMMIGQASGGGTVHGYQLSRNLHELGHQLYSWYWGDATAAHVRHCRVRDTFRFVRSIDALYLRVEWRQQQLRLMTARMLRPRSLPLVIELNGTPDELDLSEAENREIDTRLRRYGGLVDGVVAVSDGVAEYARRIYPQATVRTISNGSDPELFKPKKRAPSAEGLVAMWIGTTSAGWHDLGSLIGAAKILAAQNAPVEIRILGNPENLPAGLPRNIRVLGQVPYQAVAGYLCEADVGIHLFVKPERVQGSPLKIFDYMACGLAVVGQPYGQVKQIADSCRCVFTTASRAEDLAQTLMDLAAQPEHVREAGLRARQAVVEYYNWRRVAQETVGFLTELRDQRKFAGGRRL